MTAEEFWQILHEIPASRPVFYRLYHDESGVPICYSMEDLPGTYIEIDQSTYARNSKWVRIKRGQLVEHKPWLQATKLVPGDQGTQCDVLDVMIVTSQGPTQKWMLQTHDQD